MSPEATLIKFRHDSDLLSVLRADGPWAHPAEGAEGLMHAVLEELVSRRQHHPVLMTDGAFTTVEKLTRQLGAARGCDATDVASALLSLQADRLVESCGAAVGQTRWRATEHAMFTARSVRIAA